MENLDFLNQEEGRDFKRCLKRELTNLCQQHISKGVALDDQLLKKTLENMQNLWDMCQQKIILIMKTKNEAHVEQLKAVIYSLREFLPKAEGQLQLISHNQLPRPERQSLSHSLDIIRKQIAELQDKISNTNIPKLQQEIQNLKQINQQDDFRIQILQSHIQFLFQKIQTSNQQTEELAIQNEKLKKFEWKFKENQEVIVNYQEALQTLLRQNNEFKIKKRLQEGNKIPFQD